jgi:deoxyribose-phosphate aldolase
MPIHFDSYPYDDRTLRRRLEQLLPAARPPDDRDVLKKIIGLIDLTMLEGSDTEEKVAGLCRKALDTEDPGHNIPPVAAVCVYPTFVRMVRRQLDGSGIRTASVAGAFPSGQAPLRLKLEEVKFALGEGAEEIDMVMSYGRFLQHDESYVFDEIAKIKEACGKSVLKVILETGELSMTSNIRRASEIALTAGADFIKTSTGKIKPGATLQAALVILDTLAEYRSKDGRQAGFKAAGGIADPLQAWQYALLASAIMGKEYISKSTFRIGASKLADTILSEMT